MLVTRDAREYVEEVEVTLVEEVVRGGELIAAVEYFFGDVIRDENC